MSRQERPVVRLARRAHASAAARGRENGRKDGTEGGFTLVELLVAIGIFAVLTALVLSGLTATVKTVNDVRSITNLTEEARVATERMTRELRQSSRITAANGTSVTFEVDFSDNHTPDPETLTYDYIPGTPLKFTAKEFGRSPVTLPILDNVTGFTLRFWSNSGEVFPNTFAQVGPDRLRQFATITRIDVTIKLRDPLRTVLPQEYKTQAHLRNQNQN